jgi:hypothetical protein
MLNATTNITSCWFSSCWVSLCRMLLCWMSWRHITNKIVFFSFFLSRSNFLEDLSLKGQINGDYILCLFGQLSFPRMVWSIDFTVSANRSFTLAKFVSETVSDSNMKQYLPWPPWVTWQEIETILSVSHCPRWPIQVNSDCRCHRHYRVTFTYVNTA